MGHTHAVRMGARRGTRGDYDYHANITLKQIGMFDRTIVRLELWFERNPQEPGGPPSLNDALAGMFHKRAIALRRSRGRKGHRGRSRKI